MKHELKNVRSAVTALFIAGIFAVLTAPRCPAAETPGSRAPRRIVSLAPSTTEILFALGIGDRLVGVTDFCDYPAEARKITRVGGLGNPSLERLMTLQPDLVIVSGTVRNDAVPAMRRLGLRVVTVTIANFAELFAAIETIGRETGTATAAERLVRDEQAELDAATQRSAHLPPTLRRRVFVEIWHDPLTTVGNRSFVHEVVTRAGGINVAGDISQPYARVGQETVVTWNPDVIVTAYMGQNSPPAAQIASRIGWGGIAAVKNGGIVNDLPNELLLRPGPRLVHGVKILAERLYPTAKQQEMGSP